MSTGIAELLQGEPRQAFLKPWIAGLLALLTLAVGLLASLSAQIHRSSLRPFFLSASKDIDWAATWICLLFVISVVALFWLIYRVYTARAQVAEITKAHIDSQVEELAGYIRRVESLPPEDFLLTYQTIVNHAALATSSAADAKKPEDLEQAIRNVIGYTLILAAKFDKRFGQIMYRGNIMIYTPWNDAAIKIPPLVPPVHRGHCDYDGYLELVPELSTTCNGNAGFPRDPAVKAMGLPVRVRPSVVTKPSGAEYYETLPVAPVAFEHKEYVQYPSMLKLNDWLDEKCGCSEGQKRAVSDYFSQGDGKHIKSLASLAILSPSLDSSQPPLGVLNFHLEEQGLLQQQGDVRFVPLMEPFLYFLSTLLLRRTDLATNPAHTGKGGIDGHRDSDDSRRVERQGSLATDQQTVD